MPSPATAPTHCKETDNCGSEAPSHQDNDVDDKMEPQEEYDDLAHLIGTPDDDDLRSHVSVICRYVSRVAEHDYDEALTWVDDVLDQMRNALGEPPELDDDGDEGDTDQ